MDINFKSFEKDAQL